MKKLLFITLLFSAITTIAQNTTLTVIRRLTNQTGTIPASDTSQGVVKVDTSYNSNRKYLRYIGTTDMRLTFPSGAIGNLGWMYIYIPSDSIIAKVMSVTQVGDATIDTFRIEVNTAISMTGSKGFKSCKAKDYGYSFTNDGSLDGRANNVVVKSGESISSSLSDIQGTSGATWQEPVIISAGQTDILIIERKAP